MSNYLAIATVTATLGQTILSAVQSKVSGAQVTTQRPDDPKGSNIDPRVNVFLYQVTPNTALRNDDLPTRRGDGSLAQRPRAALDLHYLLTFYGEESKLEPQRLLGGAVSALHARSVITRQAIRTLIESNQNANDMYHFLITTDLAQEVELVKFTPLPLNLEELSKLWSVFFQTPYTLSLAYQASVVLIEEERETPQPALPVRDYNVYALPFRQPVIEKVTAGGDPTQPILVDSTLVVEGQNLRAENTKVKVGGVEVDPQEVTNTRISLPLTSLPAGTLRAGVQGVQVVHRISIGTPPTPHRGIESNVAAFVLRPKISNPQALGTSGVKVTFDPEVSRNQRTLLLLNEFDPPPPEVRSARAYTFNAPRDNGITTPGVEQVAEIIFPISGVQSGDYLVRAQVEGAESPLDVDASESSPTYNMYIGPRVTI
ncbi:MAG: DUF4255 domain-containing protein [Anaerolineales bacterium]|jgi:hypothetical protein